MTALTSSLAVNAALGFVVGLAVGFAHFATLAWNARLFVAGSMAMAIGIQMVRIGLVALVLILLARHNFVSFVAGALALLAARAIVLSRQEEPR